MRITQKDIARALGLSLITVTRALNGKSRVSDDTRDLVQQYAREHGYVPHRASQVLVRNKTRRVALFSSTLPLYFWDRIRQGVDAAAAHLHGYDFDVHYHSIPDQDTGAYLATVQAEIDRGVDAMALVNQTIYDMEAVYRAVQASGIPYVTFNVDAPGTRGLCYIGPDYVAGGRLAAEVIATSLQFKSDPVVLIIADNKSTGPAPGIDLNADRLRGFLEVIRTRFPRVRCDVRAVETGLQTDTDNDVIVRLLEEKKDEVDATYLIPAINPKFVAALEAVGLGGKITVVHDFDPSAERGLDRRLVTAVIHQNPVLQGYNTVKTLERIVENGVCEPLESVEVAHNVIFAENKAVAQKTFEQM